MTQARAGTFGAIMQANRGVGPGFDFMRLALSLSVVLFHSFQLSYGRDWSPGVLDAPVMLIVPAFFALSGFLVAGSMMRTSRVSSFLLFRALRIIPALGVEITLSALILGPLVTSLPRASYFAAPEFARYFTNVLGIIRYALPGVFDDNPLGGIVNGQLWTVPSELRCYIVLALLMVVRLQNRPRLFAAVFAVLALGECATAFLPGHHYTAHVLNAQEMLVLCFLCGNVFFLWRDAIPASIALFATALAAFGTVFYLAPALSFSVGAVAATYVIVYLGTVRMPRIPLLMGGDYSYGIYLYSFPIQQTVIWAFPDLRTWYFNLAIAGPLTILFAAASWHGLERPVLSLRKRFSPRSVLPREVLPRPVLPRPVLPRPVLPRPVLPGSVLPRLADSPAPPAAGAPPPRAAREMHRPGS